MDRRPIRRALIGAALIAGALAPAVVTATPASAAVASPKLALVDLPDGDEPSPAGIRDVACPAPGACVAVGGRIGRTSVSIFQQTEGVWQERFVPMPADVPAGSRGFAELHGVSCPAPGSCVAVGEYATGSRIGTAGLVVVLAGGRWTAFGTPVVGDALFSRWTHISCPVPGTCAGVGWSYTADKRQFVPLLTIANGAVATRNAPMLEGALEGRDRPIVGDLDCSTRASCVAVGFQTDGNHERPIIWTMESGAWAVHPVVGRREEGAVLTDRLRDVACGADGCVAVGGGDNGDYVVERANGDWTVTLDAPASSISAVACPTLGSCVVGGPLIDLMPSSHPSGSPATISTRSIAGGWTTVPLPLAVGADPDARQSIAWSSMDCNAPGSCAAMGAQLQRDGGRVAVAYLLRDGTWTGSLVGSADEPSFPSAVDCTPDGTCAFVGSRRVGTTQRLLLGMITPPEPALPPVATVMTPGGVQSVAPLWGVATSEVGVASVLVYYRSLVPGGRSGAVVASCACEGDTAVWAIARNAIPPGIYVLAAQAVDVEGRFGAASNQVPLIIT